MSEYAVRFVHKVAGSPCRCGHGRYDHHDLHAVHGSMYGHGMCSARTCECTEYQEETGERRDLSFDIMEHGDECSVARTLRQARLLPRGGRLDSIQRSVGNLVCFLKASTYHSIIIRPWVDESNERPSDLVATGHEGIYRVRWTRDGRCYVTSAVNGGLIGAYRGRWDDAGRLPDRVREYAEGIRPH